jgi:hypothetical protein
LREHPRYEPVERTAAGAVELPDAKLTPPSTTQVGQQRGHRGRLFERSRIVAWVRTAVEKLGFPPRRARHEANAGGPPIELDNSCADVLTGNTQVTALAIVPLPHQRPARARPETPLAARFGFAFVAADQTPGVRNLAREFDVRTSAVVSAFASTP